MDELEESGIYLNPRQRAFLNNLLRGMTQADAYEAAGYTASGKAAEVNASRMLSKAKIKKAYFEMQKKANEDIGITREDVIRMLKEEAQGREDSTPASRVQALQHLSKHFGIFEEHNLQKSEIRFSLKNVVQKINNPAQLSEPIRRVK